MKKLLFLFIPLISLGQLSYSGLMKIDSKNAYVQYMFDLQFSAIEGDDNNYALNPSNDDLGNDISTHFAYYFDVDDGAFFFQVQRMGTITNIYSSHKEIITNDYDKILRRVKRRCKYVFMRKINNDNYACYSCKDAEFQGYIGFSVIGTSGIIAQIKSIY